MARARATSRATRPRPPGLAMIDIAERDVDVPLSASSASGRRARSATGSPSSPRTSARPSSSRRRTCARGRPPHRSARRAASRTTAPIGRRRAAAREGVRLLDRLTKAGHRAAHFPSRPSCARALGKFYYRPPGGESWCDVILRLRSVLDTIELHYRRRARADRRAPGGRALPALSARADDGGADPRDRRAAATSPTAG